MVLCKCWSALFARGAVAAEQPSSQASHPHLHVVLFLVGIVCSRRRCSTALPATAPPCHCIAAVPLLLSYRLVCVRTPGCRGTRRRRPLRTSASCEKTTASAALLHASLSHSTATIAVKIMCPLFCPFFGPFWGVIWGVIWGVNWKNQHKK